MRGLFFIAQLLVGEPIVDPLVEATLQNAPRYLTEETALEHVTAAREASDLVSTTNPEVTPELLLAMAYIESRYDVRSVSRLVTQPDGTKVRKTGLWKSDRRPSNVVGNMYCGITQSKARSWRRCMELRQIDKAYVAAALELKRWNESKLCRKRKGTKRMTCALLGYGGGNAAIRRGEGWRKKGATTYPRRVRARVRQLERPVSHPDDKSIARASGS